ncbi:MAG: hypothetical protein MJZ20_06700 [Bacteroidaceae bacterium]|nr:hypothetical protein [Bacteroidaceae bacterium]
MKIELTKQHRGGSDSTTFSGRPEGEDVRKILDLDKRDKEEEIHQVVIPNDTTSFNPSFFLGLFYASVKFFNSVEKFRAKYQFDFSNFDNDELREYMKIDLEDNCQRCSDELNKITGLD